MKGCEKNDEWEGKPERCSSSVPAFVRSGLREEQRKLTYLVNSLHIIAIGA